jgi:hypothetical protein
LGGGGGLTVVRDESLIAHVPGIVLGYQETDRTGRVRLHIQGGKGRIWIEHGLARKGKMKPKWTIVQNVVRVIIISRV